MPKELRVCHKIGQRLMNYIIRWGSLDAMNNKGVQRRNRAATKEVEVTRRKGECAHLLEFVSIT